MSNGTPSTIEERVARLEKMREEDAAKFRVATIALGGAVVVTAFAVRAANRRSNTVLQVPPGYSVTALPPGFTSKQ
jgi:hypothetical protein